jgi:hypothetical protein
VESVGEELDSGLGMNMKKEAQLTNMSHPSAKRKRRARGHCGFLGRPTRMRGKTGKRRSVRLGPHEKKRGESMPAWTGLQATGHR